VNPTAIRSATPKTRHVAWRVRPRFFEDLTADVLRRAGIGSDMEVLDLGCGVGDVSVLVARMVGEFGAVLGIDRAASSVETARRRAAALGVRNVQFETAELDAFDSAEMFDAP
jgi:ubiquinone/menaquinone biosynthesis C-methylase UbiE